MQTEREYAISLGLAKPTRGRMSAEAHAAIAEARSKGMVFAARQTAPVGVNAEPLPAVRVAADPDAEPGIWESFAPTPEPLRSGMLTFVGEAGKVTVNSTEACIDCKTSFSYDYKCRTPRFRDWRTGTIYTLGG